MPWSTVSNAALKHSSRFQRFLALLDYVSRAHEIEICPVVRPSPVCVAIEQIPFTFQLWLPLGLKHGGNVHFWKINHLFWFLLWSFQFLVNIKFYGSPNFKTLLLPQLAFESFQTFSEFSSEWSSQSTVLDFWNFEFFIFQEVLALLDYVSTAHGIEIRPSSVRACVASIISEVIVWISFKF